MKLLIAIILTAATTAAVIDKNSDAYKLGWIEGRAATLSEVSSLDAFNLCVEKKERTPEQCWAVGIDGAKAFYVTWDNLTDQQKLEYGQQPFNHHWLDNLNGQHPYDMPAYFKESK